MNELEDILGRLGEELARPMPALEVPTVEAEGASEDQLVRVSVSGGKVASVTIDPRSMRRSGVELADDVRVAVNAALKAHADALTAAMQDAGTDPSTLGPQLDEVGREASRTLGDYLELMTQMMDSTAARQG